MLEDIFCIYSLSHEKVTFVCAFTPNSLGIFIMLTGSKLDLCLSSGDARELVITK